MMLLKISSIRLGFCVSKILFYFFVISFVPVRRAGKGVGACRFMLGFDCELCGSFVGYFFVKIVVAIHGNEQVRD